MLMSLMCAVLIALYLFLLLRHSTMYPLRFIINTPAPLTQQQKQIQGDQYGAHQACAPY
jgi:hypothetical protein